MPVTYIERRRISRNKFIGFTPIGDRGVARRWIPRRSSRAAEGDIYLVSTKEAP